MDKTLRKAFLLGMGITLLSKDKVEKEVRIFMKQNKLTEAESRKLVAKALREAAKHKKQFEKHITRLEKEIVGLKK